MYISGMPEAPDLEVVKDYLNAELKDAVVESCKVLRPTVVRSLATEVSCDLPGRTFLDAQRRGKFLTLRLSGGRSLVINPMLTGALQHCDDSVRVLKKTCVNLSLAGGMNLRYLDDRQMGKVYYIINGGDNDEARGDSQEELIPQYTGLGPDVLSGITLQEFETRLKKFNGEIKGVLTRGAFISGIGNAYSDEILFAAGISPFQKMPGVETGRIGNTARPMTPGVGRSHRDAPGPHGQRHSQEGSRLSNGAQQGRPALPQVRRKHHSIKRQPAHHQLLPPLPTWFANSQLIPTRLHQLLSDCRYNLVKIPLDYPFQA